MEMSGSTTIAKAKPQIMAEKTKVYALAVGITDYPSSPLSGCVDDADRMIQLLKNDPALDVAELTLFNDQATKTALVGAIRNHLGRAQAGEAAFFYFSGHGAREKASTAAWKGETDETLECLACHGAGGPPSLLADKELRCLLHEVAFGAPGKAKAAPPHILAVFDCCHSGDNTRAIAFEEKEPRIKQKRFAGVFPQRDWKDFIFSDKWEEADFAEQPIAALLPEGPHVQLAACLAGEPALEVNDEGLFTKNLLKVLEDTNGNISYASLHNITSNYIRHQFKQNPQLYVQGGDPGITYSGFLGKPPETEGLAQGRVQYSQSDGWLLNLGAMHGISEQSEMDILLDGGATVSPTVEKLTMNTTFLDLDRDSRALLDKKKAYPCRVAAFSSYPISVLIKDKIGDGEFLQNLKTALAAHQARIRLTEQEADAGYLLQARPGQLVITPPFEPDYPLVHPTKITGDGAPAVKTIAEQLAHIAKWEYVKELHNENVRLFRGKAPLRVEVRYKAEGEWMPYPYTEKGAAIDGLEWVEAKKTYRSYIKVELTNDSERDLYYSFFYLTINFESSGAMMEKQVELIRAGETVTIFSHKGGELRFYLEPQVLYYNLPESKAWFKVFISTQEDINTSLLTLRALPPPVAAERARSFNLEALDDTLGYAPDWTTMLVPLHFKNPGYKREEKKEMQ